MASTLHQITTARDGEIFISIGPVTIHKQYDPKTSKNNKLFSGVVLRVGSDEMRLTLWEQAAEWKLPLGETLVLKGRFIKNTFNGAASLNCDELSKPENAVQVKPEDIQRPLEKPSIKECIETGLRAADYMIRKERPELAEAAFSFAANARFQGAKPE